MKLVIMGGTYNPPHIGHIAMADFVRRKCSYDKVVLIPSFQPAHKIVSTGITPRQRLDMTELAAGEIENAIVSDCEIRREGVSYSIDTVRYLKDYYNLDSRPGLIIGDDLISGFHKWHKVDELVEEADIIVLHRGNKTRLDLPFPHTYLSNDMITLSSSEIREKVRNGQSVSEDVPASVAEYIRSRELYLG
jgi:nicotinate-nucleotide adenylyltransferase